VLSGHGVYEHRAQQDLDSKIRAYFSIAVGLLQSPRFGQVVVEDQ
jgi:hypothetical protein